MIEVFPGTVRVKINEVTHDLSLNDCLDLINKLKSVFPAAIQYGQQIAGGITEFSSTPKSISLPTGEAINLPEGWTAPVPFDPKSVFQSQNEERKEDEA